MTDAERIHTLRWRRRAWDLEDAISKYLCFEPGTPEHVLAQRRLRAALLGEPRGVERGPNDFSARLGA